MVAEIAPNPDTYTGLTSTPPGKKMKILRNNKTLFSVIMCAVLISSFAFSTESFASVGRATCSGDICGSYGGGTGTHIPGGSGRGSYGGRNFVYFAYTPETPLTECTPDNADNNKANDLGYPSYSDGQTWYRHYLSASDRATGAVVAGWDDTPWFGLKWSSDNGVLPNQNTPVNGPASGPGGDLFPAGWKYNGTGGGFCLPLKGGGLVEEALNAIAPAPTMHPKAKAILKMKKSYVSIEINETSLSQSGVDLYFELKRIVVLICDKQKGDKAKEEWKKKKPDTDPPALLGCNLDDDPKSPIKFNMKKMVTKRDGNIVTVTIPVTFKKKGKFAYAVGAEYQGHVTVNGVNQPLKNVTKFSGGFDLDVRSSKAVNRKK